METVDEITLENIMRRMTDAGLNQRQLAKKANVDTVSLNRIFKGKRGAGKKTLTKLAEALQCSVDDLLRPYAPSPVSAPADTKTELLGQLAAILPSLNESQLGGLLETAKMAAAKNLTASRKAT